MRIAFLKEVHVIEVRIAKRNHARAHKRHAATQQGRPDG